MTILNKDLRSKIEAALLSRAFDERANALVAKRSAFAIKCYDDYYSKKVRDQMNALPEGWLAEAADIHVKFGFSVTQLVFDGRMYVNGGNRAWYLKDTEVPKRRRTSKEYGYKIYERDALLAKEFAALENEHGALEADYKKARDAIREQTYAFSTVEKLGEHWPEALPVLKSVMSNKVATSGALVPVPKKVNDLLKLP